MGGDIRDFYLFETFLVSRFFFSYRLCMVFGRGNWEGRFFGGIGRSMHFRCIVLSLVDVTGFVGGGLYS